MMHSHRPIDVAESPASLAALLLLLVWLLPGLFGLEPWKPDGAYSFGLINHVAHSGDWVVPYLAGEPFMEKPPLYYITAALFENAFGSWMSLPDAARLATALYLGLAFWATYLSGRLLYGGRGAWWAPLVLIGTLGFPVRAHQMITDTALFAGIAWGLYGLLLAPQKPVAGGVALGLGAAAAMLSKGLLGPGMLGLCALSLPLCSAGYRSRRYLTSLAVACIVGLPLPLLWMIALYRRDHALFDLWFFANNFGRFFGTNHLGPAADKLFYLRTLPWYAFPTLPLACYGVWRARRSGDAWRLAAPLALFAVALVVLTVSANARELYAMPLLAPLCLLAVSGIAPGGYLSLGGRRLWALAAAAIAAGLLLVAVHIATGHPVALAHPLARWTAGWQPHWAIAYWIGGGLALALLLVLWRAAPAERMGGQVWRWCWMITLIWALAFTLWLPAVDIGMGYQVPFGQLRPLLQQAASESCVASDQLDEPQRALIEYYDGLVTRRIEVNPAAAASCRYLLVYSREGWLPDAVKKAGLSPLLRVARPGDRKESVVLFAVPGTVGALYRR
ncbi:ArnT family glycosyltransferase [Paludibacterium yongneupense]|uniref:ArnT family glycosyltransferase n=1 Tax=Paludibacterium yongneupense TaxID=400061 RepID=UPI0006883196|nr:glycosyltransferase family 39 protein [Paludibacterium yongneupense]